LSRGELKAVLPDLLLWPTDCLCCFTTTPMCPILNKGIWVWARPVVPNFFRFEAPYQREINFAAPSSNPTAIRFEVWWRLENLFSMTYWKIY